MFVKALNQDPSGEKFVIEATSQFYADLANNFLKDLEKIFIKEGLQVDEIYENEDLSDLVAPLYQYNNNIIVETVARINERMDENDSINARLDHLTQNKVQMPRSFRESLIESLKSKKKIISSLIKKDSLILIGKEQLDFEVTVILFCQAMKQRTFVYSGRYDDLVPN